MTKSSSSEFSLHTSWQVWWNWPVFVHPSSSPSRILDTTADQDHNISEEFLQYNEDIIHCQKPHASNTELTKQQTLVSLSNWWQYSNVSYRLFISILWTVYVFSENTDKRMCTVVIIIIHIKVTRIQSNL